jgi:penicillin amidase
MHLDIRVPNTWYRAMFQWPGNKSSNQVIGVTLPGTPVVVVGSNSRVAWGFTNTGGDWVDLIILEIDPSNPDRYLTPDGYRSFEVVVETIKVKGGDSHEFEIRETIWGPVIDEDHQGRPRALRWIAHEPGGVNFEHLDLEQAASVQEAVEIANRSGIPPQNFVCADTEGNIAWTVEGRIPRRVGFSGRLPSSWADGAKCWDGWLDPAEYPRIVNPVSGIIWTANARVVDGEMLAKMGDGGYVLGSRAKQIRDSLKFLSDAKESDMLEIQLDDRAVFLEPWQKLILQLLNQEAIELDPRRAEFRALVEETWTGRASIESVSYRLVRAFRQTTIEQVLGWVVDRCGDADPQFSLYSLQQREAPVWSLLTKRPAHLLDPQFDSWREALLSNVDSVISYFNTQAGGLRERSWGELNTSRIQHPLSRALPILSSLLDMPAESLPGDDNMPRVQSPSNGASERFAVSPGHEDDAYFQMPGGQSGHPLSPYYRAGHENWREGRLASFLPGAPEKILGLKP